MLAGKWKTTTFCTNQNHGKQIRTTFCTNQKHGKWKRTLWTIWEQPFGKENEWPGRVDMKSRVSHFWVIFPNHFASSRDECMSHSGTRKILVLYVLCQYLPAILDFCVVQLHFWGKKNLIIKSSCVNQIYYFWVIENILEFTCVTYMLHMYEYVYVTCVTYVMDNFIPNSVFIGFICLTSPLCVLKCVLKLPAREETKSHLLHLF